MTEWVKRVLPISVGLCLVFESALAAQNGSPLVTGPELGLPSLWRIVAGFVAMVVVAMSVIALLRKLRPWVPAVAGGSGAGIILISQRKLSRNLHAYVLQTQQQQFLVVSSSQQVVVTALASDQTRNDEASVRIE